MACTQCGNAMGQQERYCSKCGRDSAMDSPRSSIRPPMPHQRDWGTHVQIVAWILIISAIFMAIPGLCLLLFPGMLMAGVAMPPFVLAGPLFLFIALTFISIPAGIAAAGVGLLRYREWARTLTIILSVLMLIAFPFGTAIGIYALWVLLSDDGRDSYKARSVHAMA
jgi:hypothetical protein